MCFLVCPLSVLVEMCSSGQPEWVAACVDSPRSRRGTKGQRSYCTGAAWAQIIPGLTYNRGMSASPIATSLELGWLVVCLPASDFAATTDFYKRVGFITVGGQPENG